MQQSRFRRILGVQKKYLKLNPQWINEPQLELMNDSFESLNKKYGLTQIQVLRYAGYLKRTMSLGFEKRIRQSITKDRNEQRYQLHKERIAKMTVKEIQRNFNVSRSTAYGMHRRVSI